MADLKDLNKPDLESNYATEVLQTLRGHLIRLWKMDYSGMAHGVAGMRRMVTKTVKGKRHIEVHERSSATAEHKVFDSVDLLPKSTADVPGLDDKLARTNQFGAFTLKADGNKLHIYYQNQLVWQLDASGHVTAEDDVTAKQRL
ncbi:hypothetical protein [Vibrio coralliilyticus]|uniref:hypothetical protein n=1 Tax=Vibrio coralliilyticus TaxID=190893 RepID=UPI0018105D40|nr:hypothetical protein [Vibrio coralliilyticus]NUW66966.1 hypothetical protein [Vibrio coralliilyticus]NUW69160.1 hypothetical protein [Vibrio coralliilyticus]